MASRRARIKTCANIPIRKKNVQNDGESKKESAVIDKSTEEGGRITENSDIDKVKETTEKEKAGNVNELKIDNTRCDQEGGSEEKPQSDKNSLNGTVQLDQSNHDLLTQTINKAVNIVQKEGGENNVEESENVEIIHKTDDIKSKNKDGNETVIKKPPITGIRRRFIKPTISNNVISRAVKNKTPLENPNDINSNKIEITNKPNPAPPLNLDKINDVESNVEKINDVESNVEKINDVESNVEKINDVDKKGSISENLEPAKAVDSGNAVRVADESGGGSDIGKPLSLDLSHMKTVKNNDLWSMNGVAYLGEPDSEIANGVNINLNETSLPACDNVTNNKGSIIKVLDVVKLPKPHYIDGTKSGSDTEYPPQALSPNKCVNRPRIKAIPRIGRQQQRRTSFSIGSASESEDDTKKSTTHNRNRNDSVCSQASANGDTSLLSECLSQQKKEYSSVIQRKCRRTEQSRKLAEARREFMQKFANGKPDRQRLTMMDLIFYNPVTSPMSQKKKNNDPITSTTTETNPDDPAEKEAEKEKDDEDEENTVPAPQITIGANGEIIVDEKSLVIENKATIKSREALKQSQIVNGDFDTSYGIYKRVKRAKDWSKEETLRFYKALNTIGTDFTMMNELFPRRTRRELKLKFKKEERMNKFLVDRAVMQPVQFDMTELRRELEVEEVERREAERLKKEKEELLKERSERNNNTKKRKRGKTNEKSPSDKTRRNNRKSAKKRSINQEIVKKGINSLLDSDSDDSSKSSWATKNSRENSSDSDSDYENKRKKIQTTKSGRISKPRKIYDSSNKNDDTPFENGVKKVNNTEKSVDETEENNGEMKSIRNQTSLSNDDCDSTDADISKRRKKTTKSGSISKINSGASENGYSDYNNTNEESPNNILLEENNESQDGLTPGSLMILTDTDKNGEPVQKIYTVNENGEKVPIELTPDIMEDLMKSLPDLNVSNVSSTINQENGEADWSAENTITNLSLGINDDDLKMLGEDSMVIPFEELMTEQAAVKV